MNNKESKAERFTRVIESRVNKAISMLKLIGQCSNRNVYEYHPEQVSKVFSALQSALNNARARYIYPEKRKARFSLGDPAAAPAAADAPLPMIFSDLPDGTCLCAEAITGDYPGIQINRVKDGLREVVAFVEYNPGHPKEELCVAAYISAEDDTKYYAPYCPEHPEVIRETAYFVEVEEVLG